MRRAPVHRGQLAAHLRALFAAAGPGELIDLRWRRPGGMGQRFYRPRHLAALYRSVGWLAGETDVYLGVAPRRRRAGGRQAVAPARVLWVDCDTPQAARALEKFSPAPSIVVASGGGEGHRHAYWLLSQPLEVDELERANRTLARALGADDRCADAARVLRPAGTNNFKHDPPRPVTLESGNRRRRPVEEILAGLPPAPPQTTRDRAARASGGDPLLAIAPPDYVRALLGVEVGRDGKIACPFHGPERTPSLHVYPHPEQGWYCYGCHAGGSILDLAARLWLTGQKSSERGGQALRGREFVEVRERLVAMFFGDRADISRDPT